MRAIFAVRIFYAFANKCIAYAHDAWKRNNIDSGKSRSTPDAVVNFIHDTDITRGDLGLCSASA